MQGNQEMQSVVYLHFLYRDTLYIRYHNLRKLSFDTNNACFEPAVVVLYSVEASFNIFLLFRRSSTSYSTKTAGREQAGIQ